MWVESRVAPPLHRIQAAVAFSNLHIGLIAVCFTLGTSALLRVPASPPLLLLAFCGAFLVYQLERGLGYAPEDAYNHPDRLDWIGVHRTYFWLSVTGAALVGLCTLPFLRMQTLAVCVVLGVFSMLYMVPLTPGSRRLKSVWYLKPLLISGGWAVGGVVLPVIQAGAAVTPAVLVLALYRFLFVAPNTLLADWPDRHGDRQAGLTTAATLCSSVRLKQISVLFIVGSVLAGLAAVRMDGVSDLLYVDLAGPLLLLACVLRPWSESRWLYSFLIDIIVAWPAVTAAVSVL